MRRAAATLGLWLALAAPAAALARRHRSATSRTRSCAPSAAPRSGSRPRRPQAQRERAFIQGLIDDCKSKDEIKDALVAEFGDEVLALPDDDGFDLAAYLVPLAILLGAGGAIAIGVRRWRARPATAATGPAASTRESKRLDDDLAKYDL